jgi:DNA-binding GntR family transcriptional regulator
MLSRITPPIRSLREIVYEYLRRQMNEGQLLPGSFFNLKEVSQALRISTTPLREALVQLESEGFVTIFPRRGAVVNALSLKQIRNIYQLIGALEGSVLLEVAERLSPERIEMMAVINDRMMERLREGEISEYLELNLQFHGGFLDLSENEELLHQLAIYKQRLYEFPRNEHLVMAWEEKNHQEHEDLVEALRRGDFQAGAHVVRDVHWSFQAQEPYVRSYYALHLEILEKLRSEGEGAPVGEIPGWP